MNHSGDWRLKGRQSSIGASGGPKTLRSERDALHVGLERRAGWLVMAARLVLLRSRFCLPASLEAQEAAQREVRNTHWQLDAQRACVRPWRDLTRGRSSDATSSRVRSG